MNAKLTFLGTGTSQGVPIIGCDCEVCRSSDPRDRRLRSSVLVEYGGLTMVVDAGPDFRYQMLRADVRHLDAILLTHYHKDHTGGLDDVRAFNLLERHPVNIYCQDYVVEALKREYAYVFAQKKYPGAPEWHVHTVDPSEPFLVHSNANEEVIVWEKGFGFRHYAPVSDADASAEVVPIQGWHLSDRSLIDKILESPRSGSASTSSRGWGRRNRTSPTCRTCCRATRSSARCFPSMSIPPTTGS